MAEEITETVTALEGEAPTPDAPRRVLEIPWVQALGFALLALIPRIIYLVQIRHWPFFANPILDAGTQWRWAQQVVQTPLWLGNDTVVAKAPLYTYFLTFNVWLCGPGGTTALFSAHLLQLLSGAITCGLIYLIGRKTFGAAAGAVGAVLFAFFGPQIFNEGELLDTTLSTLLSACFLLALLYVMERPTAWGWLGTGMLLGLAGISRANLLLLAPVVLVLMWRWLREGREAEDFRALGLAFLGGIALVILAITARNLWIAGQFIPITNTGGVNFYTGNNPKADGYSPIPAGLEWERSWYLWKPVGRLTVSQQDTFYRGLALQFWREHPGAALALLVKKCYLYWNAYDIPNNLSLEWGRANSSLLRALPLGFGVVGTLGLLGLALGARRSREAKAMALAAGTIMVSVVMVFVNGRYRAPMLPALMPFAGLAVVEVVRAARARERRVLVGSAVGLLVFGLFVNTDLYGVRRTHAKGANRDFVYLGQAYQTQGRTVDAREAFRKATQADPDDPDAWIYLGQLESQTGYPKEAAEHYRKALAIAPDYARAASWLAELSISQGWPLEEPKRLLDKALSIQTDNLEARISLVRVDIRTRDPHVSRDFELLAKLFAEYNQNSKEYPMLAQRLQGVIAEAMGEGLTVPRELQGGSSGQPPMGYGGG